MKKKATWATAGIIAVLCIICFAISFRNSKEVPKVLPLELETVSPKPNAGGEYYAHKAGGSFKKPEALKKQLEEIPEPESLWVDYEPEEVSDKLSEEEQMLIDEVVSKIPIRESVVGLTKEEFVRKMERLDDVCQSSIFLENAESLFEMAQEEQCNEYFLPAIWWIETCGGKFVHGDFNYSNVIKTKLTEEGEITLYDKDTKKPLWENFESGEDCIETFFYRLDLNYKSATTLTEFTARWAPNTALHPHQAEYYAISLYENMLRISNL